MVSPDKNQTNFSSGVLSRRNFLYRTGMVAAGAAALPLLAACGEDEAPTTDEPAAQSDSATPSSQETPAVISSGGKMTYWGGLIFSDAANDLLTETVQDWGTQNGFEIDVVMINENETNQKVSAAVESGTMPDAFDLGLDLLLLLSTTDQLEPLNDLYDKIGSENGGWLDSVDSATEPAALGLGDNRTGIPYGSSGNVLFSRRSPLEAAGLTPPPETWQELSDWAEQAQEPPLYGMGFSLSNVGDGNQQVSVLQSFGGRIADDEGKTCTIKSPETQAYLEWVVDAHEKGLFPPGVTTWDGAGDNTAYQSGQAIFIGNPGSVYLWMVDNDPELLEDTMFSAFPAGPKERIAPINVKLRGVPKGGENVEAAKALVEHLSNPEFLAEYYKVAIYGPALTDHLDLEAFDSPVHAGLADLAQHGTGPAYPDVYNTAYADFNNNFVVPKMIQRVVIDGWSIDEAIDEAQQTGDSIYAKYQ